LRLDAEIVRDNGLAASGLLCRKIGGPSVFPPQPEGLNLLTQKPFPWPTSVDEDRFRRGMYTFFKRSAPYPALSVFDAPDATSACTRRIRSNTPLQALTMLNDQAFVEMARGLAQRVIAEGPSTDEERVNYAFRLCVARNPTVKEASLLTNFLATQREAFKKAFAAGKAFLGSGEAVKDKGPSAQKGMKSMGGESGKAPVPFVQPLPREDDIAEYAAWTALARVLLNVDEFINRE
jgi:hypothetical protein